MLLVIIFPTQTPKRLQTIAKNMSHSIPCFVHIPRTCSTSAWCSYHFPPNKHPLGGGPAFDWWTSVAPFILVSASESGVVAWSCGFLASEPKVQGGRKRLEIRVIFWILKHETSVKYPKKERQLVSSLGTSVKSFKISTRIKIWVVALPVSATSLRISERNFPPFEGNGTSLPNPGFHWLQAWSPKNSIGRVLGASQAKSLPKKTMDIWYMVDL